MKTDRRARRARESARTLTPPPTSTVPQNVAALRRGARFVWGNPHADARAWASGLDYSDLPPDVSKAVGDLADNASRTAVVAAAEACERAAADDGLSYAVRERCGEAGERARLLAAFLGHYASTCIAMHQADLALAASVDDAERRMQLETRAELSYVGHLQLQGTYDPQRDAARGKIRESAWDDLRAESELVQFWVGLDAQAAGPVRDDTGMDPRDEDHPGWFEEEFGPADAAEPAGVVVFPQACADAAGGKGESQKEVRRFLGTALGARLPLVPVPTDWDAWERDQVADAPWLAPLVRAVRASQGGRSHWGGAALCVEGPPGSGKSRKARRLTEASGLPFARYNCDATSDNSLGGTPIRWNSGHPSVVERLLAGALSANGAVLLDEVEKAGGNRVSGGHPHDLLHSWFEPETARAWRSQYLLAEVDLSHVLWICTANSTAPVPSSLLDRMTVVRVGEPGPEHLGLLAPALAREACRELGLDERWGELDSEEIQALAVWRGGSVRRLQRLVRGILQARDAAPVARH
ncbi:AAA family ATPase [Methylobacterium sp. NI91]|nr:MULTISPECIES: AAA family ATPase [unclassified Methylobacterium]QIJ77442.1 AAA family ATPase [Methylobacterium sp. CLZ]QIJ82345.1 AAA family ATPase [Methylobacterium sp. NI91]